MMKRLNSTWTRAMGLTALGWLAAGCTGVQTLSNYARTGDTVSMAVNQTEPNQFIKKEQASVTLIDSANVSHPVTLHYLIRVYSDPTSSYAVRSVKNQGWQGNAPYETMSVPYQGQWLAIVDLIDPTTGVAPSLPAGAAQLVFYSPLTSDVSSSLTILPGTGQPNPLHASTDPAGYTAFDTLEPMPQVAVQVGGTPTTPLGGGVFTISYVTADFGGANTAPSVIVTSPDRNIELSSQQQALSNGTTQIKVSIKNPHGFQVNNSRFTGLANQMSLLRDLRFIVVWDKSLTSITDANWQNSLQLVGGYYFDLNGAPVSGLTPVVTKVR